MEESPRETLVFVTHCVPGVHTRDIIMDQKNNVSCRVTNEILKAYWEGFSHHTHGSFACAAENSTVSELEDPTQIRDVQSFIGNLDTGKRLLTNLEDVLEWGRSGGNCGNSHYALKKRFDADARISHIKWIIHVGGGHAFIVGWDVMGTSL
jgi:hypothetical protein